MQPLNILTTVVHEGYQTSLAKTGHNFFSISTPERPNGWKKEERSIPENWKEIVSDSDVDNVDVVLINTPQQRNFGVCAARRFNCPIIEMFHCFPYITWDFSQISYIRSKNVAKVCVFATEESANMWHYNSNDNNVSIVGHTANEDIFKPTYTGGTDIVLSVAYDFKERDTLLGYSQWKEIVNGFNWKHIGNEEFATKASAIELANKYYQQSAIFINTAIWSPIPTALIEALSVGMPIVCVESPTNERLFGGDNNGIVLYSDIFEAKDAIYSILENEDTTMAMSEANKLFYKENFSNEIFIEKWNNVFRKAINE